MYAQPQKPDLHEAFCCSHGFLSGSSVGQCLFCSTLGCPRCCQGGLRCCWPADVHNEGPLQSRVLLQALQLLRCDSTNIQHSHLACSAGHTVWSAGQHSNLCPCQSCTTHEPPQLGMAIDKVNPSRTKALCKPFGVAQHCVQTHRPAPSTLLTASAVTAVLPPAAAS